MWSIGSLRLPRSWGTVAVLGALALWAGLGMGQLQDLLAAMHVPGAPSYTVQGLGRFFHLGPDVGRAREVVAVWEAGARGAATAGSDVAGPREVLGVFLLVDTLLFVPLYVAFLSLFFRLAERRFVGGDGTGALGPVARAGAALVLAGGLLDAIENIALWRVSGTGGDLHAFAWVLWLASLGKWITVGAAVVLALLLGWVLVAHALGGRRLGDLLDPVRTVGPVVVLVAVFALVVPTQEQLADLIRRWQAPQLTLAVFVTSGFALTAWVVARRLLLVGRWCPRRTVGAERRWGRCIFLALVLAALVQLVPHVLLAGADVDPGWGLAVPAVALTVVVLLGFPLGRLPAVRREPAPAGPVTRSDRVPKLLAAIVVVSLGLAVERASVGYLVYWREWSPSGLVLLLAAALGALLAPRLEAVPGLSRSTRPGRLLSEPGSGALAGALVASLAIGPWSGDDVNASVLASLSLVLVGVGLRLPASLGREQRPGSRLDVRWLGFVVLFLLAVGLALAIDPWRAGTALGGIGVVAVFFTALAMLAGFVSWVGPAVPLPRALRTLGLREFPLVTLLVLWFVVASQLDRTGAFHDVRVVHRDTAAPRVSLEERFDCWLGRTGLASGTSATGQDCRTADGREAPRGAQPLVLVASTGGGIRSAYWTAFALDCAFGASESPVAGDPCLRRRAGDRYGRSDALFAVSGISGGSLGIAEYAAHLARADDEPGTWIRRRLDVDGLSPAAGWWLFAEISRVFLQFDVPRDRASVLEQAWERRWPDDGLEDGVLATTARPHVPLLLLNATNVDDGCRISVSALDGNIRREREAPQPVGCRSNALFDEASGSVPDVGAPSGLAASSVLPATYDLVDYLCRPGGDVRLSTAALLSARFPYVNPSGRIVPDRGCAGDLPPTLHAVDGGYLDTSGASTLVELSAVLQPLVERWNHDHASAGACIVPFAVQIDNGFESTAAPTATRPSQLLAPPATLSASRIGRAAEAKAALAFLYSRPFPGVTVAGDAGARPLADRYAHFVNEAHPGPGAPLGWAQSRLSQLELERQQAAGKNRSAFAEVDGWFAAAAEGTLRCPAGGG